MDNPVQPGIGRGRVLRRRSRRAGMQHIFGAAERITRARAALGSLDCTISHRGQLREDPMTLSFPNKSRAFDSNRDLICRRAAKVYARGRKGSYDLVGADF